MKQKQQCDECEVELEQTYLQDAQNRRISLVTDESKGGILGLLGEKEKLTPVSYVCPECRRIEFYVED
ncbi:hypothetical protein [Halocatena marina]|uniref:Nucleic acid-binding protein n=1 Tax=Halocatena marina TaxID=2934937 RepID=A0ABD5YZG6_9EURY|nr:hypothetical protein [Halocatena marina]